jgi:hypothetical protein
VYCNPLWRNPGEWVLDFMVEAPMGALKLSAPAAPARVDGLWQSTCFELFLRDPQSGQYLEFNFSPSGEWAAYQFDGYRTGMHPLDVSTPRILSSARGAAMPSLPEAPSDFSVRVNFEHPGLWKGIACQMSTSAVIEEADGTKSYWALAHAPGKPDFHHADTFVPEFPASRTRE